MSATDDSDAATIETEIRDDRTILTIEGWPEASVIVRSESGERIYLPPEEPDRSSSTTTPYSTSPYSPGGDDNDDSDETMTSPYSTSRRSDDEGEETDEGVDYGRSSIPQGIRIIHPEPVIDVRVIQ